MKKENFEYFLSILKEKVGWSFSDKDFLFLNNKLDNFIRKSGIPNYEYLIAEIKKSSKLFLWQIIESIAPSNTSFCRDYKVFKGFEDNLLPHLLELNNSTKRLKILSLGCSTGQEMYSVAMSIKKKLKDDYKKWNIDLLGLDISTDSIVKAQKGYYTEFEIQHGLNAKDILNNFRYDGNYWQANQDLVNMIEFRRFNIYSDKFGPEKYDIILCRNVLNIFDAYTQLEVLGKIYNSQVNGGFLILGLGERIAGLNEFYNGVSNLECVYKAKSLRDNAAKPKSSVESEMPSFERPDSLKLTNKIIVDNSDN